MSNSLKKIDALLPVEMAQKAEELGIKKIQSPRIKTFVLSILAGAFIALGAIFYTSVTAGLSAIWPLGLVRLVGGLAFSLGLILVIVGGAELFTGNSLIVMAWANRRLKTLSLLENWTLVFTGNFIGAIGTVTLMFFTNQYTVSNGVIGRHILEIASTKCQLGFSQAVALGIMCNTLVCLAVWLCYSARSTTDKIMAIIFPITAFVAAGFEHSIANMYFVPIGIFIKKWAPSEFWSQTGLFAKDYPMLSWPHFLASNLLPVTIGNLIGGTILVGITYWFVYIKTKQEPR